MGYDTEKYRQNYIKEMGTVFFLINSLMIRQKKPSRSCTLKTVFF